MQTSLVFTVAQSKRLIVKAAVQLPEVVRARKEGMIAVGYGTTNVYLVEELLGEAIPKGEYVAGRMLPPGMPSSWLGSSQYPEVILKKGERVSMRCVEAVAQTARGRCVLQRGERAGLRAQSRRRAHRASHGRDAGRLAGGHRLSQEFTSSFRWDWRSWSTEISSPSPMPAAARTCTPTPPSSPSIPSPGTSSRRSRPCIFSAA